MKLLSASHASTSSSCTKYKDEPERSCDLGQDKTGKQWYPKRHISENTEQLRCLPVMQSSRYYSKNCVP